MSLTNQLVNGKANQISVGFFALYLKENND